MKYWTKFIKSLESEGGAIVVLLSLVLLFCGLVFLGFPDGASQLYFILGALVGILKGNGDRTAHTSLDINHFPQTTTKPIKKIDPKKP